jgi:hypothetical protein
MSEKHLYEYAVIRLVPMVEREEFINVGVILFCKRAKYIKVLYKINEEKFSAFNTDLEIREVRNNLRAFERIAMGEKECGPIAGMDLPERFRWLTAVRSSSIQTSRPHPGFSDDLEKTTQRIFEELVL